MARPEDETPAPLKRLDGEPTFDEPWQAQALAIADTLIANGTIAPKDWAETLGGHLARAAADGAPDTTDTYYQAVLRSLTELLADRGEVTADALSERRDSWERAYRATPHGKPVLLEAGQEQ